MSGEDYQDLQKFGANIKDMPNGISKIKIRLLNSEKSNRITNDHNKEQKLHKKKFQVKTKNISKLVTATRRWANKKLNMVVDRKHKREKQKGSVFLKIQPKYKKQNPRYRLIETRKQKGNKTIVIRKRVLIKSNNDKAQHQGIRQKTLFEFGGDYFQGIGATSDRQPNSSIWDMPIETEGKTEKWKTFLDLWHSR